MYKNKAYQHNWVSLEFTITSLRIREQLCENSVGTENISYLLIVNVPTSDVVVKFL